MGIKKINVVTKSLENIGPRLGSKDQQVFSRKRKEKVEDESFGIKRIKGFKPKKKMPFKSKGSVGPGVGLKRVKPSSSVRFKGVEKLLGSLAL